MRQVLSNDSRPREDCVGVEFTQSFKFFVRIMKEARQRDIGDLILREDLMHEATGKKRESATGDPAVGKAGNKAGRDGSTRWELHRRWCEQGDGSRDGWVSGREAKRWGSLPEKRREEHMGKRPGAAIKWRTT